MTRTVIDVEGFEAKFRENPDPWNYATSRFEAHKRQLLRRACGSRHYGRGLEIACANGATTKVLAPLCMHLLAVDASPTAVALAKACTGQLANVEVAWAHLPSGLPRRRFDLIVVSEILYYLKPPELGRLLKRLYQSLAPGGRVVCLHHTIYFNDAVCRPEDAQRRADAFFRAKCVRVLNRSHGRFRVSAYEKRI